jgi:hypothetical protein
VFRKGERGCPGWRRGFNASECLAAGCCVDTKLYPFRNSTPGSPCMTGGTLNGCGWCFPKPAPPAPPLPSPPSETDWFFEAKRGVFTHYLHALQSSNGTSAQGNASTSWTDTVDTFDADAYAESVAVTGARYATITLMQGDKFLLGPACTTT